MTVHELYAAKQKQFQEYQVQKGIYERRLEDSKEKLMSSVYQLQEACKGISDIGMKTCIETLLSDILNAKDELTNVQVLSGIRDRLAGISATIENAIREVLK